MLFFQRGSLTMLNHQPGVTRSCFTAAPAFVSYFESAMHELLWIEVTDYDAFLQQEPENVGQLCSIPNPKGLFANIIVLCTVYVI